MKRFNMGHKDWFKIELSDDLGDFTITTTPYSAENLSFDAAADYTARLIAERYTGIYVAYSGGLDSEYVMKVLQRNGIPFTTVCFINPFCTAESDYARYYCKQNGLSPIWIESTPDQMLVVALLFIKRHGIKIFPSGFSAFAIDRQLDDAVILTGTCHPLNDPDPAPFQFLMNEFLPPNLFKNSWIPFFNYTVEMLSASINDVEQELDTQEAKSVLYGLPYRPKITSSANPIISLEKHSEKLIKLAALYSSIGEEPKKIMSHDIMNEMLTRGKTI